ncbi:Zinc finger protein 320 [Exaiptasia diaphana]|nr:Zinc finger protein 320 [Exaiptasia diaphana]
MADNMSLSDIMIYNTLTSQKRFNKGRCMPELTCTASQTDEHLSTNQTKSPVSKSVQTEGITIDENSMSSHASKLHSTTLTRDTELEDENMVFDVELLEDNDYIESNDSDNDIQQPSNIEVNEDTLQANHGYSEREENYQDISENKKDCFSLENQYQPSQDITELFICMKCNLGFKCERHLENHENIIHNGTKPFKCDSCDKVFAHKNSLKIHKEAHKNKVSSNLERSGVLHHTKKQQAIQTTEKSFKCTICHKTFKQKGYLKVHIQIHRGEKEFKCNICNKDFATKSSLQTHNLIHQGQGEKPHKCTICDKAFAYKSTLNSHHRIHSAEKPYKCTICNKAFKQKDTLNIHQRIHSTEKPFKCTICNKAFKMKKYLYRHHRIHSRDQKPFKCTICNKGFTLKKYLHSHHQIHSGEKVLKCTICNETFTYRTDLNIHRRIHRGEKPCVQSVTKPSQERIL